MDDFEHRLRLAMRDGVADVRSPAGVMELVRRRYRRRNMRMAAATAVVLAVLIAIAPLASALRGRGTSHPERRPALGLHLFPGGGRLLLAAAGSLRWLYPDGRSERIAAGFTGATVDGKTLLAWKNGRSGFTYYTMNLDGSHSRLVLVPGLPAGGKQFDNQDAQLSPDGSRLGYIRQIMLPNGNVLADLRSVNLATGQDSALGPVFSTFAWTGSATMLAQSADGASLQLVNIRNGRRTTYLTARDPRVISAYEHARPGHGPPVLISPDGWNSGSGPSALAVWLQGRSRSSQPAEALIEQGHVVAFAPTSRQQLTFTWGPRGIFLLQSGAGDNVGWDFGTFAGTVRSSQLSAAQFTSGNSAAFNPAGDIIALSDSSELTTFIPTPAPACHLAVKCLRFQPWQLWRRGTLLGWSP